MDVKNSMLCDVVVVGGGNAGLVAAIEATNLGASVLLLEKGPREDRGGNSRLSGGVFRVAYDRGMKDLEPLLEKSLLPAPIEKIDIEPYTRDDVYGDVVRLTEGLADKKWIEDIVNASLPTAAWMKEQGVKWELDRDQVTPRGDGVFMIAGATIRTLNDGEGLVEALYGTVEAKGIPVLYETAAQSLIVNADAEVCGVLAKSREGMIQVNAKSVILACAGYEANPEMRRRYLGEGWDLAKLRGTRYNTGDGLRMAFEIGAQAYGHWGGCHASVVSEDSPQVEAERVGPIRYSYLYSIMVNVNGERFVDEGENFISYTYAKMGKQIASQPGGLAFQIFDAKVIPFLISEYQDAIRVESDTLEELASEAGIDVEGFINTVKQFNEAIIEDKPFVRGIRDGRRTYGLKPDKMNWAQKIDTPPFLAYAVVRGMTFAYGGLRVSEKTQVLDTTDRPIEGLYAVGELPGGFYYHNYVAGAGLVKGAVTGRIAGAHAASRAAKG